MPTPRIHAALALIAALTFALGACSDDTSNSGAGNTSANTNNSASSTSNSGTTAACTPGELGCACADGGACGDGLTCLNALCIPDTTGTNSGTTGTNSGTTSTNSGTTSTNSGTTSTNNSTTTPPAGPGLRVDSADARSCEAVLVDPDNRVQQVAFADGVTGRFMRRGERVAVAFIASDGAPFAPDSVRLVLADGADLSGVTLTRGACSDAQGDLLDAARVALADD